VAAFSILYPSTMTDPFDSTYDDALDRQLIDAAVEGSTKDLDTLLRRHQDYVYNIALRMVLSPVDAEDLTQEVLLKVITKLATFRGRSSFRTWLYRIVFNHFVNMRKRPLERAMVGGFDEYGRQLDAIPNEDLNAEEQIIRREQIQDAKLGCMTGMLMCLDRQQRLTYVLGEIFGVAHQLGATLTETSPANFRKRLERARKDLRNFRDAKCGLIREENPCRCHRKTKGFIARDWVNGERLQFNADYRHSIRAAVGQKSQRLDQLLVGPYGDLFRKHPWQEKPHHERLKRDLLEDRDLREVFDW
jgi:RNA polymerase sigma factor (sigma-70 family)